MKELEPGVVRFALDAIAPTPWKNGGGTTREIAVRPPGAGMDAFAWRVSVADIVADGPFSAFPGIDRQIALLDGAGVHLQAHDDSFCHQAHGHRRAVRVCRRHRRARHAGGGPHA